MWSELLNSSCSPFLELVVYVNANGDVDQTYLNWSLHKTKAYRCLLQVAELKNYCEIRRFCIAPGQRQSGCSCLLFALLSF